MNQTTVMIAIAELARTDGGFSADEAISAIAAMMDRLEPAGARQGTCRLFHAANG